ncbi:MAG: metalloprotease PmbA [Pseudomonadota bacterium]
MTQNQPDPTLPERARLEAWAQRALDTARHEGAGSAEAHVNGGLGLSVSVRKGEVETLEFQRDRGLSVSVYFGQRTGSASTSDLSDTGIASAVRAACVIARATGEDPCAGLADAERMAKSLPDLDLHHPWALTPEAAIETARQCEAAGFAADPRITQTEGASLNTHQGVELYANTHGFIGERRGSNHSLSCSMIAVNGEEMQRDDWWTSARNAGELEDAAQVGRKAGERAAARLGSRKIATRQSPVLFVPDMARSLFGHFISAISGGALYRKASFLLGKLEQPVFSPRVHLEQKPFIPRAASSAAYDHEGVATCERVLVENGVLRGYVLGSYSARQLKMQTTGNAGGVFNLAVRPGEKPFDELLREMGNGFVVTEMMGSGANTVTGDYSRGAAGFWVENGAISHPVHEITVAGNLADMFKGIVALGSDVDTRTGIRCGSVLIDRMTIAGD